MLERVEASAEDSCSLTASAECHADAMLIAVTQYPMILLSTDYEGGVYTTGNIRTFIIEEESQLLLCYLCTVQDNESA